MPIKINTCSKSDLLRLYGVKMPVFERWIIPIKDKIGWVDGIQQKFPPKLVEIIIEHLGDPTKD